MARPFSMKDQQQTRCWHVVEDMWLELRPSVVCKPPGIMLRSGQGKLYLPLGQVRHVIDALINAAAELAEIEAGYEVEG